MIATALGSLALAFGVLATAIGAAGWALIGLAPLLGTAGAASAGAGAAAGGAAIGFGALAASAGAAIIAAAPFIALGAAIGVGIAVIGGSLIQTVQEFDRMVVSIAKTNREFDKFEQTLIRQGVQLDQAALREMDHAQRSQAIAQATAEHKETLMAREIQAITGVEATRQQIHIAELARVGLEMERREAALLAISGVTQEEIRGMMKKGETAQAVAQEMSEVERNRLAAEADAVLQRKQWEIDGRTDRRDTVGVFQWSASEEKRLNDLMAQYADASGTKKAHVLEQIEQKMEQKRQAERAWAEENRALTSSEIAMFQYAEDQKALAQDQGLAKQEDRLYVNLATEAASLKVKGNTYEKWNAWAEEENRKHKEKIAKTDEELEAKMGEEKFKALEKELSKVHEHSKLIKVSEEETYEFKKSLLRGDLENSMQYWSQMREQTHSGLIQNLDQWKQYSAAVQMELADLRKAAAYAMNPAQTGSPSLNQEMALGMIQSQDILNTFLSNSLRMLSDFREHSAGAILAGMGATIVGNPGGVITDTGAPSNTRTPLGGARGGDQGQGILGNVTIDASVKVEGTFNGATRSGMNEGIDELTRRVSREQGRNVERAMERMGIRSVGLRNRTSVQPG